MATTRGGNNSLRHGNQENSIPHHSVFSGKTISSGPTIRQGGRAILGDLSNQLQSNSRSQSTSLKSQPQAFTIYEDANDENCGSSSSTSHNPSSSRGGGKASRLPLREVKDENMAPVEQQQLEQSTAAAVATKNHGANTAAMSDFWAEKVAKLPFVESSSSSSSVFSDLTRSTNLHTNSLNSLPLTNYSDYRLDHSISSETTQGDDAEEEGCRGTAGEDRGGRGSPMNLDESINEEDEVKISRDVVKVSSSRDEWRVPPVSFSQVIEIQEYSLDILHYLKETETKLMPKWNYMTKQPDITFMMRSILVDWLVEVGEEYKLCTETLYLAVNYIDRFLSYMSVQRAKLQLVGTACMFIAAKYEEIYPPEVNEFTYITDDTYNKKQVLRMEHLVLKVLGFDLTIPSAYFFVNQFSKLSKSPEEVLYLAQYLSELTLLDAERYLCYTPSIIGAAALTLARHTCQIPAWPQEMVKITGYTVEEFQSCLVSLHQTFTDAPKSQQQAMREKYKQDKYLRVSELSPVPISSS